MCLRCAVQWPTPAHVLLSGWPKSTAGSPGWIHGRRVGRNEGEELLRLEYAALGMTLAMTSRLEGQRRHEEYMQSPSRDMDGDMDLVFEKRHEHDAFYVFMQDTSGSVEMDLHRGLP